jgi:hypothetical protein
LQIDKQPSSKETNPKKKKQKTHTNRRMRVRESDDKKKNLSKLTMQARVLEIVLLQA